MVAHRLGQVEAYFTVREVLSEDSTAADGVLSHEFSGFGWNRFASLGSHQPFSVSWWYGERIKGGVQRDPKKKEVSQ